MAGFDKNLFEWAQRGLISKEQAAQIIEYEKSKPSNHWFLRGFLILGAVAIGIGVISIIAANWFNIPDAVKLGLDLVLLLGIAAGIVQCSDSKRGVVFEGLIVLHILMCLGSIGLISQVFHTGGHLDEALLFWALISLPVAVVSRQLFVPFFWTTVFLVTLAWFVADARLFGPVSDVAENWVSVVLLLPLFCVLTSRFLGLVDAKRFKKAFSFWIIGTGLVGASFIDFVISMGSSKYTTVLSKSVVLTAFGISLVSFLIFLFKKEYSVFRKVLVGCLLTTYLCLFLEPIYRTEIEHLGAFLTIALLTMMAIHVGSLGHRGLFGWVSFLIGVRLLIVYFQAFGGLARTGWGLVVFGIFIVVMVMAWHKTHGWLQIQLERFKV